MNCCVFMIRLHAPAAAAAGLMLCVLTRNNPHCLPPSHPPWYFLLSRPLAQVVLRRFLQQRRDAMAALMRPALPTHNKIMSPPSDVLRHVSEQPKACARLRLRVCLNGQEVQPPDRRLCCLRESNPEERNLCAPFAR